MLKKVLLLIISISILVSGYVLFQRYSVEKRINKVEIVADMNDFQDLAGEVGTNFNDLAKELSNNGVTSIAVHEVTLQDLKNRGYIACMPLSDLIMGYYSTGIRVPVTQNIIEKYGQKINAREVNNYSVVITQDKFMFSFLSDALDKRTGGKIEKIEDETSYAIIIKNKLRNLNYIGMGFLQRDLDYAKGLGFVNLIPRIQNYKGIDEKDIETKINQIKHYKVSTVIFEGDQVLGYDVNEDSKQEMLKYAAKRFKEEGLITAIIEKPAEEDINKVQRGIRTFAKVSGYTSTKVFSAEISKQNDQRTIVEQWSRAIAERNVRIIYIRPMYNGFKDGAQNLEDNLESIKEISQRVKNMGYERYIVKGLGDTFPLGYLRLIIISGVIAGGLLLLLNFIKLKEYIIYGLLLLGTAVSAIVILSNNLYNGTIGDLFIKVFTLAAAIIFPSLASAYLIRVYSINSKLQQKQTLIKVIIKSAAVGLAAVGIAVVGGLMVASLLAESKYMLKLDIFRGVKFAFVTPMVIFVVLYITKIGIYSDKDENPINVSLQLKKLLNTSVTVKYVLVGTIVFAGIIVLLLRSGNAASGLSFGMEKNFRTLLETVFVARPRSKELFAFPILMLFVYASLNRYKILSFFIMLISIIGLTDVVNSFSHIRMPLKMAVMSTVYSLSFGILTGIVLLIIWNLIKEKVLKNYEARRETH